MRAISRPNRAPHRSDHEEETTTHITMIEEEIAIIEGKAETTGAEMTAGSTTDTTEIVGATAATGVRTEIETEIGEIVETEIETDMIVETEIETDMIGKTPETVREMTTSTEITATTARVENETEERITTITTTTEIETMTEPMVTKAETMLNQPNRQHNKSTTDKHLTQKHWHMHAQKATTKPQSKCTKELRIQEFTERIA
jgi:hypothetical protein